MGGSGDTAGSISGILHIGAFPVSIGTANDTLLQIDLFDIGYMLLMNCVKCAQIIID